MLLLTTLSRHTSTDLSEVGFLFILIAGVWLVVSEIPALRAEKARSIVAGICLAVAGILLIVASHWGKLG